MTGQRTTSESTTSPMDAMTGERWSQTERERLLEALALHPRGPWDPIEQHVRSKSRRQIAAFVAARLRELSRPSLNSARQQQQQLEEEMEAAVLKSALLFVTASCQASEAAGAAWLETSDPSSAAMMTELLLSTDSLFAGVSLPGDEFEPL